MLKKTITYEDYNGQPVSEDYYFNLTKSELVELQLGTKGGFAEMLQEIVKTGDGALIIDHFKKIILMAYGVKSDDGKRFIKSDELSRDFEQSAAYDALFIELATNAAAASQFINGIVPLSLAQEAQELAAQAKSAQVLPFEQDVLDAQARLPQVLRSKEKPPATEMELIAMSRDELLAEIKRRRGTE